MKKCYKVSQNLFFCYGHQSRQLNAREAANLAHVHYKTALRWLNGTQQPQAATEELLFLKSTGRVLPYSDDWYQVFIDESGKMHLPGGERLSITELNDAVRMRDFYHRMMHSTQLENKRLQQQNALLAQPQYPT